MVHIYNGILLSHKKNESEPVLVKWMNLKSVIQSEVIQKQKNKYSMLTLYMECRKMVLMNLFAGEECGCRHTEWTCRGRKEWDEWRK